MVYCEDNFLPLELFDWLSEKAKLKSYQSLKLLTENNNSEPVKYYTHDKKAWDLTYRNLNGNLQIPIENIGHRIPEVIELIRNKLISQTSNHKLGLLDNVHFLFSTDGYEVPKHIDKKFKSTHLIRLSKIYKAFIFCNTIWETSWGGELCFDSGHFSPLPNRLILYSIDEVHWVKKVTNNENNIRINFGMRFGDEKNI